MATWDQEVPLSMVKYCTAERRDDGMYIVHCTIQYITVYVLPFSHNYYIPMEYQLKELLCFHEYQGWGGLQVQEAPSTPSPTLSPPSPWYLWKQSTILKDDRFFPHGVLQTHTPDIQSQCTANAEPKFFIFRDWDIGQCRKIIPPERKEGRKE